MSARSVVAALVVLLAAGFGTWLFLPLINVPANVQLPPTTFITPVGPFEVNWMLLVLLVALGAPMPALILALVLRWLGRQAASGATPTVSEEKKPAARASATQAPAKTAATTTTAPGATVAAQELSTAQKVLLSVIMLAAIAIFMGLVIVMLPRGFHLF